MTALSRKQPYKIKKSISRGNVYQFIDDEDYWSEIVDFCVKDDYLYVLFGYKGLLKVYDINGNYIKSFAVLNEGGGSCRLYMDPDYVYLLDEYYNYYLFKNTEFIRCEKNPGKNAPSNIDKSSFITDKQLSDKGDVYYIKGASIYRKNAEGDSTLLIKRPVVLSVYQGSRLFFISLFFMCILVGLIGYIKRLDLS